MKGGASPRSPVGAVRRSARSRVRAGRCSFSNFVREPEFRSRRTPVCGGNSGRTGGRGSAGLGDRLRSPESLLVGPDFPVREPREYAAQGLGIAAQRRTSSVGKAEFAELPCIFPADQGLRRGDEFAPDSSHRQVVCSCRDCAPASRNSPRSSRDSAGFWQGLPSGSEPETAGSGPRRCRRPSFSLLPTRAVRIRSRFAASGAAPAR